MKTNYIEAIKTIIMLPIQYAVGFVVVAVMGYLIALGILMVITGIADENYIQLMGGVIFIALFYFISNKVWN